MNINKLCEENQREFEEIDKIINEEGVSLFGAGQYGEFVSEYLLNNGYKVNCFIDSDIKKHGNKINGIEIVSKDSILSRNSKVVFITALQFIDEIKRENKTNYYKLIFFDKWFTIKNFDKLLDFRDCLFDNASKKVLDVLIYSKISENFSYYKNIYKNNQYFCINRFKDFNYNEIYVDIGAFVGDTIEKFIYLNSGVFDKIYAFEMMEKQFEALNTRCKRLKIEWAINNDKIILINEGISNYSYDIFVNDSNVMSGNFLSNSGDHKVKVSTLDSYFYSKERSITFLKADIEGCELNMLKGAVNTIKRYKPKMAICVYHKPDDLLTIPKFIKDLVPEYKFALRHHSMNHNETVLYCWID